MPLQSIDPEREAFSVVVLGNFNPSIFQPLWFSTNGLLPKEEAETAVISIVHPEIASFSIGKVQVQVESSRLGLTTLEAPQGPVLRDLAIGTLSILEHTPLKALGLNFDAFFSVESSEAWDVLSNRLAPASNWEAMLDNPGMRQIIVDGQRQGCDADRVQFRVQPSRSREIMCAVNQHYQLDASPDLTVRDCHNKALKALRDDWVGFVEFARASSVSIVAPPDSPI